jgi:hypothetical protein
VRSSPPLYGTVRQDQCQLRDTTPPTLVRPMRCTLERGRRNPRKGDRHLFRAFLGPRRDVRLMRCVFSVIIGLVRPSPPSRHHPGHCSTIRDAVGLRGDKTQPRQLLCTLRPPVSCTLESAYGRRLSGRFQHHHPRSRSWMNTGHATTLRPKQDSPGWQSTPQHCAPYRYT